VAFLPLGQTSRQWVGLTVAVSGAVYASVDFGDIYKLNAETGIFEPLGQHSDTQFSGPTYSTRWWGLASSAAGNVYAAASYNGLYKQTNESGNFERYTINSEDGVAWPTIRGTDVYFAQLAGQYIRKQTGGAGNFSYELPYYPSPKAMASAPNGDVYYVESISNTGQVFKQTNGIGSFVALGLTSRNWNGIAVDQATGDVYATEAYPGDIYKQSLGVGEFVALGEIEQGWGAIAVAPGGDVYALHGGDIYKQSAPVAPVAPVASAQGGILENTISWTSVAGATSYNIYWSEYPLVDILDTKITGVTSPYDHTGLEAGTPIYYIVTAVGDAESDPSNEVSATPSLPTNSGGSIVW